MKDSGKLKVATPNDRDVVVTREFDAPRKLVFDAHTKPELIKRWLLGPPGWSMPICEVDFRVGGKYRYGWAHPSEPAFEMTGVFREIVVPERIVHTEDFVGNEALITLLLSEKAGKTTHAAHHALCRQGGARRRPRHGHDRRYGAELRQARRDGHFGGRRRPVRSDIGPGGDSSAGAIRTRESDLEGAIRSAPGCDLGATHQG